MEECRLHRSMGDGPCMGHQVASWAIAHRCRGLAAVIVVVDDGDGSGARPFRRRATGTGRSCAVWRDRLAVSSGRELWSWLMQGRDSHLNKALSSAKPAANASMALGVPMLGNVNISWERSNRGRQAFSSIDCSNLWCRLPDPTCYPLALCCGERQCSGFFYGI
jgi:hypothetical protein